MHNDSLAARRFARAIGSTSAREGDTMPPEAAAPGGDCFATPP